MRAFFQGFRLLKRKRRIQNTPTSTIRAAALGMVEVYGKVVGPYTLIAPLAQVDCYYYRIRARCSPESDREGEQPNAKEETLCVPFFLEDGTGRLMVDPRAAEIDLPPDLDEQCSAEDLPESWRSILEHHGFLTAFPCHVQEWSIKPGDVLYALGTLAEGPARDYKAEVPPGSPRGILSREAATLQRLEVLEAMRLPPAEPSSSSAVPETEFEPAPRVMLRKTAGEPFFISSHSEREVVVKLAANSTIFIWGGPLMALVSVGVLLHWLGLL